MRLGYVIVYVRSVSATVEFYEAAFGLARRFVQESGQYAEMETVGATLAFAAEEFVSETVKSFRKNRPDAEPAGSEIGLVCGDVEASYARALSAGAAGLVTPLRKPWGQVVAYVRDNNGFLVELCSEMAP